MDSDIDCLAAGEAAVGHVKKNVKEIIEKWAGDGRYGSENIAISVFMAGSPGAGKTEFSKRLIEILEEGSDLKEKVIRIDTDEIRVSLPQYIAGKAEYFQRAASLAVDKIHDYVLKRNKNFILDSTFSNFERAASNIERSLKHNRAVFIFYMYLDPLKAWDYTQKREKLEGRNIRKEDFITHFFQAKDVVNKIKEKFGKEVNVSLVERDTAIDDIKLSINIESIDNHLKIKYNRKDLTSQLKELV